MSHLLPYFQMLILLLSFVVWIFFRVPHGLPPSLHINVGNKSAISPLVELTLNESKSSEMELTNNFTRGWILKFRWPESPQKRLYIWYTDKHIGIQVQNVEHRLRKAEIQNANKIQVSKIWKMDRLWVTYNNIHQMYTRFSREMRQSSI